MARPFVFTGTAILLFTLLFYFTSPVCAVISLTVSFIVFIIFSIVNYKNSTYVKIFALSVMISAILFTGKYFSSKLPLTSLADENKHSINATLCENPQNKYDRYYYILRLNTFDGKKTNGKIRFVSDIYLNCKIGDEADINEATVYTLSESQNVKDIYIGCYTDTPVNITENNTNHILNFFLNLRTRLKSLLNNNMAPKSAGICLAVLTGDTSGISEKTLSYFRYSGISHIFAVSGLHLSLWVTVLFTVIGSEKNLRLKGIATLIFVIIFMFIAGFSKSVMRAGIMNIVFSLGLLTGRKHDSLNSLFISVVILIFINPFTVADLSFLMSFLSCFGLITFGNYTISVINKFTAVKNSVISYIIRTVIDSIVISVTATVFLLPVTVFSLKTFSVLSPVTNLLCLITTQIMMVVCVLGIIVSPLKCSGAFFFISEKLCGYILAVSQKISSISICNIRIDSVFYVAVFTTAFILIIILAYLSLNPKRKIHSYFALICAVLYFFIGIKIADNRDKIRITVPDTGNGSYVILEYRTKTAIIGCGGSYEKAEELENTLNELNRQTLSLLLIPRSTKTESYFAKLTAEKFDFQNTVICNGFYGDYTLQNLNNTVITDKCTITLGKNCTLEYENGNGYSYCYVNSPEFTSLILFKPLNDISVLPVYMRKCDYLIARQDAGNIPLSGFKNIILQTDKTRHKAGICMTSANGKTVLNIN